MISYRRASARGQSLDERVTQTNPGSAVDHWFEEFSRSPAVGIPAQDREQAHPTDDDDGWFSPYALDTDPSLKKNTVRTHLPYDVRVCLTGDPESSNFQASTSNEEWHGLRFNSIVALVLFATTAHAAGRPQAIERPRIGLALSGGGARGIAHIGVLRWFEEHRIPIDYIAGTSMGGLVGGMYAAGMTTLEITSLVENTDWDQVLDGLPPYPDLTFLRKEDERDFATAIEFGLRGGPRMPRGLNEGHAIGLILDRVTLPYNAVESFDDLPIPFRTLATELVEGRLEVFDRGSLSEALRATMALPGIFTPVVAGDRIYVDGGLLNNIPTDVVGDMGAEVVIAVNVGTPLLTGDDLDGWLDILSQSVAVMGIQNDRANLELADIVFTPDLGPRALMDFSEAESIIQIGYLTVGEQSDTLDAFSLAEDEWQRHLEDRASRKRMAAPEPQRIDVVGTNETAARGIQRQLENHIGQPLDRTALERTLTRIVGSGRFASLGYGITPEGDLRIDALEKTHGPPFVRMGLDVDSATGGMLDVSVGARVTAMDLGGGGAEWRSDLKVGIQDVAATEYLRPLGASSAFIALRAWWAAGTEGLFEAGNRIAELRTRQSGAGLDVGYGLRGSNQLRVGFELRSASASIQTGDPLFPGREGGFQSAFLRWEYDGYDRPVIPTRGLYTRVETRWFSEEPELVNDLVRSEVAVSLMRPVSSRVSVFATLAAGHTTREEALPVQQFTLGGPLRLSARNRGEYRDGRFLLASIGYLRDLGALLPYFGDRLYATVFYEAGRLFTAPNPETALHNLALAFGTRSPLGPVWFGGAWGEGAQGQVFFRVGRLF